MGTGGSHQRRDDGGRAGRVSRSRRDAGWCRRGPSHAIGGTGQRRPFAAGIVLAAVAGEVLPELRESGALGLVIVGFAAAVDHFIDGLLVGTGAVVAPRTAIVIAIALTFEVLGTLVLGEAGSAVLSVVLAFAAAALLWLVVEELARRGARNTRAVMDGRRVLRRLPGTVLPRSAPVRPDHLTKKLG